MIHGRLGLGRLGAMRTDRNANPIAAAVRAGSTNAYTKALDSAGVAWTWGDPFPGDPSMVTIRVLGDPVAGARAILSGSNAIQAWYINHTGAGVLGQYGVTTGAQFAALPVDEQNAIVAGIYKNEGGSGELMTGGSSSAGPVTALVSPLTPSPADSEAPVDVSSYTPLDTSTGDGELALNLSDVSGLGMNDTTLMLLVAGTAAVLGWMAFS